MKKRLITAIIILLIILPIIYVGGITFALAVGVISILGFKEVIDLKKSHKPIPLIPCIFALTALLSFALTDFNSGEYLFKVTSVKLALASLGIIIPTVFYDEKKYTTKDAFYLLGTSLFLGLAFNNFIVIRDMGLELFFYLLLIPVCTDTFAFFFGCKYGKHKMCPKLSPKKSWEGGIAGLVFGTLIPCIFYRVFISKFSFSIILCTMILSIMGQIGDLLFSKIKRENDIKDFSNLMPGHGGILDRLDSAIIIFMTFIVLNAILF